MAVRPWRPKNPAAVYMAVTPDEYELPLLVCDTSTELARQLGIKDDTLCSALVRGTSKVKTANMGIVKIVRVNIRDKGQGNK